MKSAFKVLAFAFLCGSISFANSPLLSDDNIQRISQAAKDYEKLRQRVSSDKSIDYISPGETHKLSAEMGLALIQSIQNAYISIEPELKELQKTEQDLKDLINSKDLPESVRREFTQSRYMFFEFFRTPLVSLVHLTPTDRKLLKSLSDWSLFPDLKESIPGRQGELYIESFKKRLNDLNTIELKLLSILDAVRNPKNGGDNDFLEPLQDFLKHFRAENPLFTRYHGRNGGLRNGVEFWAPITQKDLRYPQYEAALVQIFDALNSSQKLYLFDFLNGVLAELGSRIGHSTYFHNESTRAHVLSTMLATTTQPEHFLEIVTPKYTTPEDISRHDRVIETILPKHLNHFLSLKPTPEQVAGFFFKWQVVSSVSHRGDINRDNSIFEIKAGGFKTRAWAVSSVKKYLADDAGKTLSFLDTLLKENINPDIYLQAIEQFKSTPGIAEVMKTHKAVLGKNIYNQRQKLYFDDSGGVGDSSYTDVKTVEHTSLLQRIKLRWQYQLLKRQVNPAAGPSLPKSCQAVFLVP